MSEVFSPATIQNLVLPNRFVRAATWEGMADAAGAPTERLISAMTALAAGGVGLIITSHNFVRPEGQASMAQLGMHEDIIIEGHRRMTEAVHKAGGRIAAQLSHAGNFADESMTGEPPLVASAFAGGK